MHNNYYFLRQLSQSLERILSQSVVSECFSQNKDELIVRFETFHGSFYIRASLQPGFNALSFPEVFHRARKNSIDLFEKIVGQRVHQIRQFRNERSFAIQLSNDLSLLFKMHGNRSNVILFEGNGVIELFKNSMEADRRLNLHALDREIDWSFENFEQNIDNLQSVYFTFGKLIWQHLQTNFTSKSPEEKWNQVQEVLSVLGQSIFYITVYNNNLTLSLIPLGNIVKTLTDPVNACNEFFSTFTRDVALQQEKNAAMSELRSRIQHGKNYLAKTFDRLNTIHDSHNYKVWADLIMANLHTLDAKADRVVLRNFYHNDEPTEIKLKKNITPQKNAELFYRKAKNQHLEIERLQQALITKEKELEDLERQIKITESTDDLATLRTLRYTVSKSDKPAQALAYHEFEESGFKIWVGKDAKSNDILTLKLAYKEDLWLHAKDVPGSHVIIKYQAGKKFPKHVIERAAQLAAYNSKRKNETLAPVAYTPKKYVRKRKGDPEGMVVVERESVILVEPKVFPST